MHEQTQMKYKNGDYQCLPRELFVFLILILVILREMNSVFGKGKHTTGMLKMFNRQVFLHDQPIFIKYIYYICICMYMFIYTNTHTHISFN
jgi:hypothetical protein